MPTKAQWEFAARGGKSSKGFDFSGGHKLDEVSWYGENSHLKTRPVGLKLPNELGLYDMSGNVWEWCLDTYESDYYENCKHYGIVTDPEGPKKGDLQVLRGGSWFNHLVYFGIFRRNSNYPTDRNNKIGFRLALVSLTK